MRTSRSLDVSYRDDQRARERFQRSLLMLFGGLSIALLSLISGPTPFQKELIKDIGYAFIVAGAVSLYLEYMNMKVGSVDQGKFEKLFQILGGPVMRKIVDERKDYLEYHHWAIEKGTHSIFFAGHSVVHRIDADFKELSLSGAEAALLNKIDNGSDIKIMFLDPRWEFFDKIADFQKQNISDLHRDLMTTLEICKSIAGELARGNRAGRFEIALSSEINQYAYHYVRSHSNNNIEMLIGLYFAGRLGINCPLFVIESDEIRGGFQNHFDEVFRRSDKLIIYSRGQTDFRDKTYDECIAAL